MPEQRRLECPQCGMVVHVVYEKAKGSPERWCPRCYATHDKKIILVRVE